jgi:hypothetical protein
MSFSSVPSSYTSVWQTLRILREDWMCVSVSCNIVQQKPQSTELLTAAVYKKHEGTANSTPSHQM